LATRARVRALRRCPIALVPVLRPCRHDHLQPDAASAMASASGYERSMEESP
jgi:hypothetical protein